MRTPVKTMRIAARVTPRETHPTTPQAAEERRHEAVTGARGAVAKDGHAGRRLPPTVRAGSMPSRRD
ncbi:MAG: hypothetical protein OXH99_14895 [Bryobacterales bacterium]|nr:hypothetical protein [Bryobacterales bacterium]